MSEDHGMLAERLKALVEARAKPLMDDLSELWKLEVKEAMEDLAQLLLLQLTDPKNPILPGEITHAKARVANWGFVGADLVRAAIKDALKEALELLGSLAKGFIK